MSQQMNEEDYLRKHLEKTSISKLNETKTNVKSQDNSRIVDLQYQAFDSSIFPCGRFYPIGSSLQIRPALVKEIQAYSMVDDNNFPDIIDKMNDMLMSCVRIKYNDESIGNYLDIKEQDRIYLLFLIRELTFQHGTYLTVNKTCQCKNEVQIELKPGNFKFFETIDINKFFNNLEKCYTFDYNGQIFNMSMPNIGIQKSFTQYITSEIAEKKDPNLSFLKIWPCLLGKRNNIDIKEIKEELKKFQSLSIDSFQFLNTAVSYMKFGIEFLRKKCNVCGKEVHTEMTFPNGASGIFVVSDPFERYIQK